MSECMREMMEGDQLPTIPETAQELKQSVGEMQLILVQMARLIRETRQQMEAM